MTIRADRVDDKTHGGLLELFSGAFSFHYYRGGDRDDVCDLGIVLPSRLFHHPKAGYTWQWAAIPITTKTPTCFRPEPVPTKHWRECRGGRSAAQPFQKICPRPLHILQTKNWTGYFGRQFRKPSGVAD